MIFKFPKNDKNYRWTQHIKDKMLFYRISEQKIRAILKNPNRREEGIAPNTIAVMKRNDTPKRKEELWVMFAQASLGKFKLQSASWRTNAKQIMISTWRYPGKSRPGKDIPIPEDTLAEIQKNWFKT